MLHPLDYVEGVFEKNLISSIGPHGCCILSQEFYETRSENDFLRGYTMQILRGAPPIETATSGYFMRQLSIGKNHHKDFDRLFNHTAGIAIISEDLPEKTLRSLQPNLIHFPNLVDIKILDLSEQTTTFTKLSFSFSFIAILPFALML
mgnify:CR=1 FL=1